MHEEPATEFTFDTAQLLADEERAVSIVGRSPWNLAWRRLRRNRVALASFAIFLVIVIACSSAPLYARYVAHTGPNATHVTDVVSVGGKRRQVISGGGYTINPRTGQVTVKAVFVLGPTWWHAHGRYVLGADELGRDVAVRLLYGGINSLKIGVGSALICTVIAVILALTGGYFGAWADAFT